MSVSTIGYERRHDPLLAPMEVDAFARALLAGQPTFPGYFARMRPTNQAGPALLGGNVPAIPALPVASAADRVAGGALLVDARSPAAHAERRIPVSMSIPAGSSFGTWLGWVVDADRDVVLLVESVADLDDLARQALRIGFDGLVGFIDGGLAAWERAGRPVEAGGRIAIEELSRELRAAPDDRPLVIDVRQAGEYEAGHVPGSWHINAGSLGERLAELPRDRPIVAICASGYRSSVAASMLRAAGFRDVEAVPDGVPAWAAAGLPIAYGGESGPGPAVDPATAGEAHAH
jgi:rhodanese-related sulfurtransferase